MTQQEWENASEEERAAEYERCKDNAYFYNTYFKRPNDPVLTKDDFDNLQGFIQTGGRRMRRWNPVQELSNKIEWKVPKDNQSAYDGNRLQRNFEDWDEPYHIPISLLRSNPELYLELLERSKKLMEEINQVWLRRANMPAEKLGKIFISSTVDASEGTKGAYRIWMDEHTDKKK